MAFFEDMFEGNIVGVLAVGVGAIIFAPVLRNIGKPLAKAAIKGGIMAYQRGREMIAEGAEAIEDMYAEAKAEVAESHQAERT